MSSTGLQLWFISQCSFPKRRSTNISKYKSVGAQCVARTELILSFNIKYVTIRPRLYGEKLSRVEGSPAYPSYPRRANFSYISLQNLANRLHEKQKVGSARRVTRLAGLLFCDGRVTLLAGPTFLHINTLARLAGSARSRRDDQSMRELCCYWKVSSWLGQTGQLFSHINAR